jgi:hypothetical protein
MSSTRVLMWVRGRAEQKRSLNFCVFGETTSKCFSSSTFPKLQPQQSLFVYGTPFHTPNTTSSYMLPHRNRAKVFRNWTQFMSHSLAFTLIWHTFQAQISCMHVVLISWLVKNFSMKASRILSFTFSTFNIVWGKPRGGGAQPLGWSGLSLQI